MPSKVEGVCDDCGSEVIQRKDDNEETIKNRLKVYYDMTMPLKDFYSSRYKDKYLLVDGAQTADKVNEFYDKELGNTLYDDLEKTYYFYDKDKSNNSVFTLRNFHLNIIHDLHCWELGVFFVINRLIEDTGPDNMDRVIYYDKSIYLTLRIKSFPGIGLSGMEVSPDKGVREY